MQFYVLVKCFQGIVDGVELFTDEKEAEHAFKDHTSVAWESFEKASRESLDNGLMGDCAGSQIHVCEISNVAKIAR